MLQKFWKAYLYPLPEENGSKIIYATFVFIILYIFSDETERPTVKVKPTIELT